MNHAKIGCGISNGAIGMNLDNPGRIIGLVVFLWLFSSQFSIAAPLQDAGKTTDDNTTKKISMLFKAHCNRCHGEKKPGGMVRLDNLPFELNTNADVWFSIREQIDQELMPPDNPQRFPKADARLIIQWIDKQFEQFAPRLPNQGNLVPHELLFGKVSPGSVSTGERVWRLNPESYKGLVRDISKARLDGIVQPFSLVPERGIKDFASLYTIDEPGTEILIRNAEIIVEAQTAHELKDGKLKGKNDSIREFVELMDPKLEPGEKQILDALQLQFRLAISRQATEKEVLEFMKLYQKAAKAGDKPAALKLMLQAVLLKTDALFRIEKAAGVKNSTGGEMLAPLELARALSLALGDRKDPSVFKAAQAGELNNREQVRFHVRRMLDDPKITNPRILNFFREYFEYQNATEVFKDKPKNFMHEPRVLVEDTDRLVLHVLKGDRDVLRELLTTQVSFVNTTKKMNKQTRMEELTRAIIPSPPDKKNNVRAGLEYVYGLKDWPATQPTPLPEGTRIGVLMQPSWLVAFSTNFENDPVRRGRWIRERLLGGTVPDLPIGVVAQVPDEKHRTFRDRLRVTREGRCLNCHRMMDDLGLPFENFDHYGRFRTTETVLDPDATAKNLDKNGKSMGPVHREAELDTKGAITYSGDAILNGPVNNPREMILKLAKSDRVRQVFIRHVFRYFLGRNETLSDSATLQAADKAYVESNGSFKALLVSLLSSDSFLAKTSKDENSGAVK